MSTGIVVCQGTGDADTPDWEAAQSPADGELPNNPGFSPCTGAPPAIEVPPCLSACKFDS